MLPRSAVTATAVLVLAACVPATTGVRPTASATASAVSSPAVQRPPLPLRPDGYGVARPTPPDLVDRRLPTRDVLPPPPDGRFSATVAPVPDEVLARSTWRPECPVGPDGLRYVTVVFRGFDGAAHTGELLVAAAVAEDVAAVFGELFAADFPIEEMRVVEAGELTAPPTGDDNNTTAFVCRSVVGKTQPPRRGSSAAFARGTVSDGELASSLTRWSAHARGLAVDVNPFQNPYRKADLVLPELASAYLDRDHERPGMIRDGGPVVTAFERIGWAWGGRWTSLLDLHHFSATGT